MPVYTFSENNSGGSWWLDRKDYDKLFAAGFKYEPSEWDIENGHDQKALLGATDVPYGWRHKLTIETATIREAIQIWEKATGQDFFAGGCPCCGPPFSVEGAGEYESGGYRQRDRPW